MNQEKYSKNDLIKYRLKRAFETYEEAELLFRNKHFIASVNRLYYSCYYALVALLLKHNINSGSHAGVRSQFGLHFINSGKVSKENGKFFSILFDQRQKGDYDDFIMFDEETVSEFLQKTDLFIKSIEELINEINKIL